jgi:hypothetical protein
MPFPHEARRTPGGVGPPQVPHQLTHVLGTSGPTRLTVLAQAPPVGTQALLLPGNARARPDARQSVVPARLQSCQPHPAQAIRATES